MKAVQGLSVWNRACGLAIRTCEALRDCSDNAFRDVMTRSAIGIAAQIADGYERDSKHHFAQYLRSAKGTCSELRTQLYIATQLELLTVPRGTELMQETVEVAHLLKGLIHWCENRNQAPDLRRRSDAAERADL